MIIGAYATVYYRWDDPEETFDAYFSFGEYEPEEGADSFGYPDDLVFFYAEGEDEIKRFMDPESQEDFLVVDYDLNKIEVL